MREVLMGLAITAFLLIPMCMAIMQAYDMGYKDGVKAGIDYATRKRI